MGADQISQEGGVTVKSEARKPLGGAALFYYGEPLLWLTGSALAMCVLMIVGFLGYILWMGMSTFWPSDLYEYKMKDGRTLSGELHISQTYEVPDGQFDHLDEFLNEEMSQLIGADGHSHRIMLRTCNYEVSGTHFDWIDTNLVAEETQPEWLTFMERISQKPFIGYPQAFYIDDQQVAEGHAAVWGKLREERPAIRERYLQRRDLEKHTLGELREQQQEFRMHTIRVKLDEGSESQAYRQVLDEYEALKQDLAVKSKKVMDEINELKDKNTGYQIQMRTSDGQERRISVEEIVRIYAPNRLGFFGKLGVYNSRWWEFLSDEPRQANSQGGIWPALFGTVVMTLLMTVFVVPFGVIAALYMREYARHGPLLSTVRIAINNLAGVPSIVFGVFGLGFICYIVGDYVDQIFYPAYVHEALPVFKKGGILWASCTLALLTLPVVIVATEEALSAVPNSMREGSYGCGASKWQTIRRIVLPRSLPGIMTGMILAMARGAGEVAPLMLVGAVKMAAELPTDPSASFMHLGFHIYDLSYHSQDSEAAKPMVFTTTLLLISMVAILNIVAIRLRNRLNKRFNIQTF